MWFRVNISVILNREVNAVRWYRVAQSFRGGKSSVGIGPYVKLVNAHFTVAVVHISLIVILSYFRETHYCVHINANLSACCTE